MAILSSVLHMQLVVEQELADGETIQAGNEMLVMLVMLVIVEEEDAIERKGDAVLTG